MLERPPILEAFADWAKGEGLEYTENLGESRAATVSGATSKRIGHFSLWASGECDFQVLRKKDDFLVLNEHRLIPDVAHLLDALATFREVLRYHDPRDDW
jgi:hypothetical protein